MKSQASCLRYVLNSPNQRDNMTAFDDAPHPTQKLIQHAKAAATVFQEEFQTSFKVYDATNGVLLWPSTIVEGEAPSASLDVVEFQQILKTGQVQVVVAPRIGFVVRLPLSFPGAGPLIAESMIKSISGTDSAIPEEQIRLTRWAQAVLDRLLQADMLRTRRYAEDDLKQQVKKAWELNLTVERLVRHLRIHRDVETGIEQILETAFPFLGSQSLIWVPEKMECMTVRGQRVLTGFDACELIKVLKKSQDLKDMGVLILNQVDQTSLGRAFPSLKSVMVMTVPMGTTTGWMVAINKQQDDADAEFRNADAASLAPFSALIGFLVRSCGRYQDLKELLVGLTRSLASAVDAKDPYTYGHSERVARIGIELGRELGLVGDDLSDLYLAGLLHDVGKIGIRDDVLCKHGPLTPEETEHMKQHPVIGHSILKDLRQVSNLLPGVLHHHERWDGKGYPHGLATEAIPRLARILAVADSYDAMSTSRPYRKAMSPANVETILTEGAGGQWDPQVIQAFQRAKVRIRLIRERGLGESLRQALDGALRDHGSSRMMPRNLALPMGTL